MNDNSGQSTLNSDDGSQQVIQPWLEYWTKLVEQNTQWSQALMAGVPPDVDPAAVRRQWLDAMSRSIEAFMRTPTFLESMKRHSDTTTAAKVTSELAQREVARESGLPHIEDISGLYDRLETANELVLQRLQTIEDRLEAIEHNLNGKPKKSSGKKK